MKITLQKEQQWNKTEKYTEDKNVSITSRAAHKLPELVVCLLVYIYICAHGYINITPSSVYSVLKC